MLAEIFYYFAKFHLIWEHEGKNDYVNVYNDRLSL